MTNPNLSLALFAGPGGNPHRVLLAANNMKIIAGVNMPAMHFH